MRRIAVLVSAGLILAGLAVSPASATDFTVNSTADTSGNCVTPGGTCTLRAAIAAANASFGADTITLPAGTFNVSSSLNIPNGTVTIKGAGARSTVFTATSVNGVFTVGAADVQITDVGFRDLTGSYGMAVSKSGAGTLRLERVRITGSKTTATNGYGPLYLTAGNLVIHDSEISGGTGTSSNNTYGAIYAAGGLEMINSTIHGNAYGGSSGQAFGGGVFVAGTGVIRNSTLTGNSMAGAGISGYGGNIYNNGTLTVTDSIIGEGGTPMAAYRNCAGNPITFTGRNVISDESCGAANANRIIASAQLGSLQDNGGPTNTRSPTATSPAFNASPACVTTADQRGQGRPMGAACDIGAVEVGADTAVELSPAVSNPPASSNVGFVVKFANAGMDNVVGLTGEVSFVGAAALTGVTLDGCSISGLTVSCVLGDMSHSQSKTATVFVQMPQSGTVTGTATVASPLPDPNPANNTAATTVTVAGDAAAGGGGGDASPAPGPAPLPGVCSNLIKGTGKADRLTGTAGSDRITGLKGNDRLRGQAGADCLSAGPGKDVVKARDKTRDVVKCGPGRDRVFADKIDKVAKDCERVRRK
jgi:CSLREA domain-containing protein